MPQRNVYLTVPEVMEYLRLGRTTVYAQARLYLETDGAEGIPCRRFGRSLRFPLAELEAGRPGTAPAETVTVRPAKPSKSSRRPNSSKPTMPTGTEVEPTQLNLLRPA